MSNWTDPRAVEQPHEYIDFSGLTGGSTFYTTSANPFETGYIYLFEYSLLWSGSGNNNPSLQVINSAGTIRNGSQYVENGATFNTPNIDMLDNSRDEGEAVGRGYFFNAADSSLFTQIVLQSDVMEDNGVLQNIQESYTNSGHCTIAESHTKFRVQSYGTTYASGSYIKVTKRKILL